MLLKGVSSMKHLQKKIEGLLSYIKGSQLKTFKVALMPDFFLDRFISWKGNIKQFSESLVEVEKRKGGSIDRVTQIDFRGGNAINTAAALATLGAEVFPIVQTSKLGLSLLKLYLQPQDIDLSRVKVKGTASITTAFEFQHGKEERNVMLRDVGSLEDFGPRDLAEKDYALLEKVDYVCVFNWAGTRRHGTALARKVFSRVKTEGKGKTYYDTADPLPNESKIESLIDNVLLSPRLVDILSLNENEIMTYTTKMMPKQIKQFQKPHKTTPTLAKECAKILTNKITSRIDLHTTVFSATFMKNRSTSVPIFKVKALRATGAGDAWNAGNIYADANNFPDDLRLLFANAVAAYYVSNPACEHPSLLQLSDFLQNALDC